MTDLSLAIRERDAGIARSAGHAEAIDHTFAAVAYQFLHKYAREHETFIAEEVVAAAVAWGLQVSVPKAFGSVFIRAARNGLIVKDGYAPSNARHRSPTVRWSSNVYGGSN